MDELAPEILMTVFKLAVFSRSRPHVDIMTLIKISHICQYWRIVVLNDSLLWTEIEEDQPPRIQKLCLERSRGMPLSVRLCSNKRMKLVKHFVLADDNLKRIKDLTLYVEGVGQWWIICDRLFGRANSVCHMSDLRISQSKPLPHEPESRLTCSTASTLMQSGEMRLLSVQWYRLDCELLRSFSSLVHLELVGGWDFSGYYLSDFLDILREMQKLQELVVCKVLRRSPNAPPTNPSSIILPRLSRLVVEAKESDSDVDLYYQLQQSFSNPRPVTEWVVVTYSHRAIGRCLPISSVPAMETLDIRSGPKGSVHLLGKTKDPIVVFDIIMYRGGPALSESLGGACALLRSQTTLLDRLTISELDEAVDWKPALRFMDATTVSVSGKCIRPVLDALGSRRLGEPSHLDLPPCISLVHLELHSVDGYGKDELLTGLNWRLKNTSYNAFEILDYCNDTSRGCTDKLTYCM